MYNSVRRIYFFSSFEIMPRHRVTRARRRKNKDRISGLSSYKRYMSSYASAVTDHDGVPVRHGEKPRETRKVDALSHVLPYKRVRNPQAPADVALQ